MHCGVARGDPDLKSALGIFHAADWLDFLVTQSLTAKDKKGKGSV
jgi:hypothetical protein